MTNLTKTGRSHLPLGRTYRVKEEIFNGALADVLSGMHPQWEVVPEETVILEDSQRRPDILIRPEQGPTLLLETSYQKGDAEKDAAGRLGLRLRDRNEILLSAIAVHIPADWEYWPVSLGAQDVADSLRDGRMLRYVLFQSDAGVTLRWPTSGMLEGTVVDMANFAASAAVPKNEFSRVGELVSEKVSAAADHLRNVPGMKCLLESQEKLSQGSPIDRLRTIMLYWLDSILTQRRLRRQGVKEAMASTSGPQDVLKCWRTIRSRNWYSIFDPAIQTLSAVVEHDVQAAKRALNTLSEAAMEVEIARLGERIEIGAEIYPKLTADRKTAAAFYTKPASAELLASLAIGENLPTNTDWTSEDLMENFKLADLACGTGTLLRAGFRRITALHTAMRGIQEEAVTAKLHKDGMEGGLIGTDISPIAAHLTTTTLAALGSGDSYGGTQIGWVKVGGENDAVGSLEFFERFAIHNMFEQVAATFSGVHDGEVPSASKDSQQSISVADVKTDVILMNPPYSRTRGGQSSFDVAGLSESSRKKCQARWSKLVKGLPVKNQAGMAASFLVLALRKLRPGGSIGFVLPLTAAFAPTWASTRKYVEKECDNVTAVAILSGGGGLRSLPTLGWKKCF